MTKIPIWSNAGKRILTGSSFICPLDWSTLCGSRCTSYCDRRPGSPHSILGDIYEVLVDQNVTLHVPPSHPLSPNQPPFSRPRYPVWVNSLGSLSLVVSLSRALLATSLQHWGRRYIRLAQPARQTRKKRARMRAFYATGSEKMAVPWAVEGLPTLLHLLLFLWRSGRFPGQRGRGSVYMCVLVDRALFNGDMVYRLITLMPLIRLDNPNYTPLSKPVWFLYASISYVMFLVIHLLCYLQPISGISARERSYVDADPVISDR
jgi:hypothetical protein